jgi:hypothetical protein
MSYCHVRLCCGNVFTDPLPSNGYTRHNMLGSTCKEVRPISAWKVITIPAVFIGTKFIFATKMIIIMALFKEVWRVLTSRILRNPVWYKCTCVSEERPAFMFGNKGCAKQGLSRILHHMLFPYLTYISILKMKAVRSSETPENLYHHRRY